jgi:hypothetical protein
MSKRHNPSKHVRNTTAMITAEVIGTSIPFVVADGLPAGTAKTQALKAAGIGTSLAGIPSLTYSAKGVFGSLTLLGSKKKKKLW